MRIFKTKWFRRFARQNNIADAALLDAIRRAELGLLDADLGGGVIKQRVARDGEGRSGGFRTLIVYQLGDIAVFVFGFAKNERDNIDAGELQALKELARMFLSYDAVAVDRAVADGVIWEVSDDQEI